MPEVRRHAALIEMVHAVTYFAPEAHRAIAATGLRGFWRGYFAARAAPLGPASAELVTALFAGFAPSMVARAVPEVWTVAPPDLVRRAREAGVDAALGRILGDLDVTTAATAAARAVRRLDAAGRPLAAAQLAHPRPTHPRRALWRDVTVLREHRGDGHLIALHARNLRWPEPHLLLAGLGRLDARQQQHRGWSDEEWHAAARRLAERGWLDAAGRATAPGRAAYAEIEAETDALSPSDSDLAAALAPVAAAVLAAEVVPFPNAMGLGRPAIAAQSAPPAG